jgi:hypothetical protein
MSGARRLINVIVEPKAAFADIAARPSWLLPMTLLVVLVLAFMLAFSSHVGWENYMRQQAENSPKMQDLTPEARERVIDMQVKYAPYFGTAVAIVATPVSILVIAGVLMFVFNSFFGASVRFRQAFGVTTYAFLPRVIETSQALLVLFLKDPSDFDLQNPTAFNVGFYLDPHATPAWLVSLGSSIDLFSFWIILLLVTGMAAASRKSWKTSLAGVVALWALVVVLKVGWAAIRG